jgi:aryl-alcohol dehydrogenase-like predicted oxidoreductase
MVQNTFAIGGDVTVNRLGYGAMRITGPGIWGYPPDRAEALRVLRRLPELGVNFIDTADSYGPEVSEELIHEALHPYESVTVATKAGLVRTGPNQWHPVGRPKYLHQEVLMSLRRLGLERLDLFQLHRIDPDVPVVDQLGELAGLRSDGKIRHVGLSEVSVAQIEEARAIVPIVSVQNHYNLTDRSSEDVLEYCERENLAFIPYFPLAVGNLAKPGGPLDEIAREVGAMPSQVALAWLLHRSPVMIPIPGTGSVEHLEQNCAAATLSLTDDQVDRLSRLAGRDGG